MSLNSPPKTFLSSRNLLSHFQIEQRKPCHHQIRVIMPEIRRMYQNWIIKKVHMIKKRKEILVEFDIFLDQPSPGQNQPLGGQQVNSVLVQYHNSKQGFRY